MNLKNVSLREMSEKNTGRIFLANSVQLTFTLSFFEEGKGYQKNLTENGMIKDTFIRQTFIR